MAIAPSPTSIAAVPPALEAYVETERRRADVAGVAVAAFNREGLLFAGGSGYADLSREERVTPDTLFRAASITKLFTTTLVLEEVEAGRLALDQPVNSYLDDATQVLDRHGAPADTVTVRHLLTHTSGLPVSWRGLEYGPAPYRLLVNGLRSMHTLQDLVSGQRTVRPPGKRIVYSNGAFELLGYLVQRLNGKPYEELLRERVLEPLGMTASAIRVAPGGPGVATPYGGLMTGAGRKPAPALRNYSGPAGALVTSAAELSRFGQMVLRGGELDGNRVLSAETLKDATNFHAKNQPDLDEGLGLGFWATEYRGRRLAGHDGGLAGVSTRIVMSPEDGAGVVVLSNGANPLFVHRAAERILEEVLGLPPEAVPGSPRGMAPGTEGQWQAFGERVSGRYRLADVAPPGVLGELMGMMARPRVSYVADGCLAIDGVGFETAFLYPDGEVGRYRVAWPMANGARVVIEERGDGTHVWASIVHLVRRQ
ncbi:MAG: serine hydrolase domain-containing protein [Dehalococcoidia bacterium]|nr:serine hydrolase domain-containing protein [Dehalococcoidia bacterium]